MIDTGTVHTAVGHLSATTGSGGTGLPSGTSGAPTTTVPLFKYTTSSNSSTFDVLLAASIGGLGALIGAILTFFRGKKTDRYGIYSQAFKDLTADIERVRADAKDDRERAQQKYSELSDTNTEQASRIAQLEDQVAVQQVEIETYKTEITRLRRRPSPPTQKGP